MGRSGPVGRRIKSSRTVDAESKALHAYVSLFPGLGDAVRFQDAHLADCRQLEGAPLWERLRELKLQLDQRAFDANRLRRARDRWAAIAVQLPSEDVPTLLSALNTAANEFERHARDTGLEPGGRIAAQFRRQAADCRVIAEVIQKAQQ